MSNTNQNIAIIGAGLGGLGLALGLHSKGIQCTIYEQSPESGRFSGAIMLSPNSLSILDTYGVWERIRNKGFEFEYAEVKTNSNETTDRYFFGTVVQERGIPITFDTKYSHVVSETVDGVIIAFTNGTQASATLLIAADGIHSKVRSHVAPGIDPIYNGLVAVVGTVKRSKLVIPPNEPIAGPLMYGGTAGMFIIAPQDDDGSDIMAGTQRKLPAHDREGWARFAFDKAALHAFLLENMGDWPEIVTSAIHGIDLDSIYIWPQHTLPHLPRWTSEGGKVILIGDSAHCIPPTTGQGGGQAIEDGFTLSLLLSKLTEKVPLGDAIQYWTETREARVNKLREMTSQMNNMRLPKEEQEKLAEGEIWRDPEHGKGEGSAMAWLFLPKLEEGILAWIEKKEKTAV